MKRRLFIGISLPPLQKDLVFKQQADLASLHLPLVMEPLEKLHLTINFLGPVEADSFQSLRQNLPFWIQNSPVFSLQFRFLETLYRRHDTSLVYLSPSGDTGLLKQLYETLATNLAGMRLTQPSHFLPHVVIARFPKSDPISTKKWLDQFSAVSCNPFPSFIVDQIILYESLLSKNGSSYRSIARFKLQGSDQEVLK